MKKTNERDTIFALATAQGRAGVAIIRISGENSDRALQKLTGKSLPKPRLAALRQLKTENNEKLDEALVLRFKSPHSFTGEDMVELHCHGSHAVIEAVSAELYRLGLRQARPGEFSRRAFANGKMDLTEVEGLADLIDSETEGQRKQALKQMQGGLREIYNEWREQILDALAMIEGEIDFTDEEDVPDRLAKAAAPILNDLAANIQKTLQASNSAQAIRRGIDIAIIGAPNVGKSSILNALAKREAAIVTETAGTTRDIIEVQMVIAGLPVTLADTAGLRQTKNVVEAEGVRRARGRAEKADLRIGVTSADTNTPPKELQSGDILLVNKIDLQKPVKSKNVSRETFYISAKTGQGMKNLEKALERIIVSRFGMQEQAGLTRTRHKDCVMRAFDAIRRAHDNLAGAPELAGDDLRQALGAIRELAGESDIEAVLDRVFSRFCIGK